MIGNTERMSSLAFIVRAILKGKRVAIVSIPPSDMQTLQRAELFQTVIAEKTPEIGLSEGLVTNHVHRHWFEPALELQRGKMERKKFMKKRAGIWIDHRKAVIVVVSDEKLEIKTIQSNVERQPGRFAGVRSTAHYEAQQVQADDSRDREFAYHLQRYYDQVIALIHDADAILIFGPGEAKGELKKRLEHDKPGGRVLAVETNDKMTDHEIAEKVRERFPTPVSGKVA